MVKNNYFLLILFILMCMVFSGCDSEKENTKEGESVDVVTSTEFQAGEKIIVSEFPKDDKGLPSDVSVTVNDELKIFKERIDTVNHTITVSRSEDDTYRIVLPEGSLIYRWLIENDISILENDRVQYTNIEDLEGPSQCLQNFTVKTEGDKIKLKLVNINDIDSDFEKAEGKSLIINIR